MFLAKVNSFTILPSQALRVNFFYDFALPGREEIADGAITLELNTVKLREFDEYFKNLNPYHNVKEVGVHGFSGVLGEKRRWRRRVRFCDCVRVWDRNVYKGRGGGGTLYEE